MKQVIDADKVREALKQATEFKYVPVFKGATQEEQRSAFVELLMKGLATQAPVCEVPVGTPLFAAPQAADADKVLTDEEILDVALETIGYNKDCGGKMEIEFAHKILARAAQAPVQQDTEAAKAADTAGEHSHQGNRYGNLTDAEYIEMTRQEAARQPAPAAQPYRHIKSGKLYELLHIGALEADLTVSAVYRCTQTGQVWVRPMTEFTKKFELAATNRSQP